MKLLLLLLIASWVILVHSDPLYHHLDVHSRAIVKAINREDNRETSLQIHQSYPDHAPCNSSCRHAISSKLVNGAQATDQLEYRRNFVVNMTREAWNAYARNAWGQHDLHPLSLNKQEAWLAYSGQTLVASMSTLWLMGLKEEFDVARRWVEKEMIIDDRCLPKVGALLSVYSLTGDELFKHKAREIADLYSPTDLNPSQSGYVHRALVLSEWMKQRLEYPYLSNITGDAKYMARVQKMDTFFSQAERTEGWKKVDEYDKMNWMLKVKSYIQSKGTEREDLKQYYGFLDSLEQSGYLRQTKSGFWYIRENLPINYMNSWYCHFGAMLALGQADKLGLPIGDAWRMDSDELKRTVKHLDMAKKITDLCHISTKWTETGLPPLKFFVDEEGTSETDRPPVFCWKEKCQSESRSFGLNPQLAESYFVLYRLTHDEKYRLYAWELTKAIYKHCRTSTGYARIRDVNELPTVKEDNQPAEFLSATLKYLYLIFSPDDTLPLDRWVFNADGQPLPVSETVHNSGTASDRLNAKHY